MANVVYTGCRIFRIKIHGGDRKILVTDGRFHVVYAGVVYAGYYCILHENKLIWGKKFTYSLFSIQCGAPAWCFQDIADIVLFSNAFKQL